MYKEASSFMPCVKPVGWFVGYPCYSQSLLQSPSSSVLVLISDMSFLFVSQEIVVSLDGGLYKARFQSEDISTQIVVYIWTTVKIGLVWGKKIL